MNEEAIFSAAIAKSDLEHRAAFLEDACGGDEELRARVEALLEAHENPDTFLNDPVRQGGETVALLCSTEQPGHMIGRYKLREQLGEGGFGIVWAAGQIEPVRRKVALKIIKPGMDTHAVVARFEAERQALAMMAHPNIAHVLDGGTTESGRPYFVMELIRGLSITEYCDTNKLTLRERLALFVDVCRAVQHAHQKGIIHRDIKPSNVLVTLHDGVPVPKIIDFGIAKALNQQLTEKTIYTRVHQAIGTLAYMSPEQAELSGLDIDTRADVYGLGVLLFELVTGTTPFEKKRLEQAAFHEACRIIREEEPPKASTRISSLGPTATVVSLHRQTDPAELRQLVHGDLDWIAMKSMEKDRTRRYQTANDFAIDVERCLNDEPVEARPPSAWYRFRQYTRRHRGFVFSLAAIVVVLILGMAGTSTGWVMAMQAWTDANDLRVVALEQACKAEGEADRATRIAKDLKIKGHEMEEMLQELRTELMDKVLLAVMGGDQEHTNKVIRRAHNAGVSESWIRIFQGQLALYSGKRQEALQLLEQARDSDPDSVAAWAMLAFAYEYIGHGDEYGQILIRLKDMTPQDEYDRLYKATCDELYNTRSAVRELQILVKQYPSWGLARVMLTSAMIENGWDTGDWREAEQALYQIGIASEILSELPMLLAKELMANLCADQLAPENAVDRDQWLAAADRAAKRLEERYPNCATRELAAYYEHRRQDVERAIAVLQEACAAGAGPLCESFLAALLYRQGRFEEMVDNTYGWWSLLQLEDRKQELRQLCRKLKAEEPTLSVPGVWSRTVLCATGDREEAVRDWEHLLDTHANLPWNLRDSLELFTGRIRPDELLARAERSGSKTRTCLAHFCIASTALFFDGDSEKARHHYQRCVDYGVLRIDVYFWAKGHLERMKDPAWPRWIPKNGPADARSEQMPPPAKLIVNSSPLRRGLVRPRPRGRLLEKAKPHRKTLLRSLPAGSALRGPPRRANSVPSETQ